MSKCLTSMWPDKESELDFKAEKDGRRGMRATIEREQKVIEFLTKIGILILKAIKEMLQTHTHTNPQPLTHTHTNTPTSTHPHTHTFEKKEE